MRLFTDPNCGPCTAMLPAIGRWQEEHAEKLTISLISRGKLEENRAKSTEHGLQYVLLQDEREVSKAYQVSGTPSAVLIQSNGTIGSPVMGGVEAIRTLLNHAVGERAHLPLMQPQQAKEGEPCPNCGKAHPAGRARPTRPASRTQGRRECPRDKARGSRGQHRRA